MRNYTSDNEVYGAKALYMAIVVGTALLLAGAIWAPAPAPAKAPNTAIEQVVVTSPAGDKVGT
ncbi:MAG TPA: hypothetical protein VN932_04095 [Rhizomicrobium sp.]|nr:hypothetical protein [Rhizomicrobium sp.]